MDHFSVSRVRVVDAPELTAGLTERDGGPPQFDHYAIQTLARKFIRLELHAEPDNLHSDWKQRCQTIMLRAGRDPSELKAGAAIRELYDLRQDPGEHRSLLRPAGEAPEEAQVIAADMEAKLDEWIRRTRAAANG